MVLGRVGSAALDQASGLGGVATVNRELAELNNANDLSHDEWLGLTLDREAAIRAEKRLSNRLPEARRYPPDSPDALQILVFHG